jgi:acetyl esterase/lipase
MGLMDLPLPGFVLRVVLGTASSFSGILAPNLVDPKKVERTKNIAYGESEVQRLDIYRPRGRSLEEKIPVALLVHGGGFRFFSKNSHAVAAARLAESGRVVFCIDYRLTPANPFPAGLVDTIVAYDWLVKHAESYGGDIERISLIGESSGANYILSLCLYLFGLGSLDSKVVLPRISGPKPKAVIAHCGYLEVANSDRFKNDPRCHRVARSRIAQIRQNYLPELRHDFRPEWRLAEPNVIFRELVARGERLPPGFPEVFVPVGELDPVVADSERLGAALAELGQPDRLKVYPGVGHAFYATPSAPQARVCWTDIVAFLTRSSA